MKKIFLIGAAALGMFFMTTSCMDNTEPAGIEEMRMAKSELLRAEALYKQALAATEQANAAIKQADAEYKELVNQLKEIEVQEAQIDLEVYQKQQELKLIELEYEHQAAIAEDSATIMQWKSKIAWYEWEIIRCQKEAEDLENKRLEALEQHKAYMYDLQALTAEAQQRYENALAKIEAASYGLTEDEKGSLAIMIQNMKNARDALNQAENTVVDKQSALLAAQYALGRDTVYYQTYYQILVDAQYREVVKAQEVLTEAQAMDFTDVDKLTEEKETLEAENETLTREIADLRRQASDKAAAELDPLNNQLKVIDGQIDAIKHSINELYVDLGYDYNNGNVTGSQDYPGAAAERHVFELEIPEAIVPDVAETFNAVFGTADNSLDPNDQPDDTEIIIISGFEKVDGEWTLPGGIYSWEATYKKTKDILFNTSTNTGLLKTIANLAIDPAKLSNYQLILSEQEAKKAEIDADYAFYLDVYNKGLAEFNTLAAEYGITYNSAWEFVADKDNLLAKATEAHQAYTAAATPTAAQTEAFVVAVYNEQKARQALVGTAVAGWDKLAYANITATTPTATMQQVLDAYDDALANPVEEILMQESYPYTEPITTESKLEDYCAAAKWNEASKELYGWHYLRAAITEDIIGYGDIFEINVPLDNWASLTPGYDINVNGVNELEKRLQSLGGDPYTVNVFKNGLYYEQLGQSELVDKMSSIIANNASYTELAEALDALNEEIKTLQKTDADNQTEIYKKIRDLHAQKEALEEQKNEINIQISAKELEIAAIADYDGSNGYSDASYSQAAAKQSQINSNDRTIGVINQAIKAIKFEIDGNEVDADNNGSQFTLGGETYETIEEFYNAWVDQLKIDLADAQKTLSERQEDLECMLAANGDPMEEAVRIAERDLEQAQQDYDIALQQFNYWNELMNQMLAALLGNEEVPENPEA